MLAMLEKVTVETFAAHLGEAFRIRFPDGELELRLVDVEPGGEASLRAAEEAGLREPFSIVFRGPPEYVLPQRIYRIEHDELDDLEIFLVPIGPDDQGMLYEAVFG